MNNLSFTLVGAGAMIIILVVFGAYYLLAWLVRKLAERNLFWTFVEEGTAKAIMRNGRFIFAVMSFSGHMFRSDVPLAPGETRSQVQDWDIVPYQPHRRIYLPLLRNVRWIGLPPFTDAHKYRFSWTSLEEERAESGDLVKKYNFKEAIIDYVLVQDDVYVTKIVTAECRDNIPLDAVILFGGRVVNPYKALFAVERWHEATVNRIGSKTRDFFGQKTYAEIRQIQSAMAGGGTAGTAAQNEMDEAYREVTEQVLNEWGFKTNFIRIYQVDPGSKLAEGFIRATTVTYVAEEQKKADTAAGEGFAARDSTHLRAIAGIPGGMEMFKWLQVRGSNLTTYVEGGGVVASIPVGGQGTPPSPTPPSPPPAS